jgi:DNA-binding NarL/FixJ family response regulator
MAARVKNGRRSSNKRRIYLVEDHPITREGFAHLLNFQADLEVCGQTATPASALAEIAALKPDLVILEISLPHSSGLELIKNLVVRQPGLPILVLSACDEALYAERCVRSGARGYIMKRAPTNEVMGAVRLVLQGELYLSEPVRSRVVQQHLHGPARMARSELETLSDRELEVFELIGRGQTTRSVAASLSVSVSTVETHRAHIKEKLRLANAMELVRRAVEWVNRAPP